MYRNHVNTFLESGCTYKKPKLFSTKYKIAQDNPAESEKDIRYIHNGKGTTLIKKIFIKT